MSRIKHVSDILSRFPVFIFEAKDGINSQFCENPIQLGGMNFQTCFGPYDIVGTRYLLRDRHLGGVALLGLFGRPAASPQAFALGNGSAGNAHYNVEVSLSFGFVKKRYNHDSQSAA